MGPKMRQPNTVRSWFTLFCYSHVASLGKSNSMWVDNTNFELSPALWLPLVT